MAERDWRAWHDDYDVPGSGLARRLAAVQDRIRDALDSAPPGPLRVYRAGRGFGFFSFARRFLLAHVRGRSWSSRNRRSSLASAQIM